MNERPFSGMSLAPPNGRDWVEADRRQAKGARVGGTPS